MSTKLEFFELPMALTLSNEVMDSRKEEFRVIGTLWTWSSTGNVEIMSSATDTKKVFKIPIRDQ